VSTPAGVATGGRFYLVAMHPTDSDTNRARSTPQINKALRKVIMGGSVSMWTIKEAQTKPQCPARPGSLFAKSDEAKKSPCDPHNGNRYDCEQTLGFYHHKEL